MSAVRRHVDVFLAPGQLAVYTRPVRIKTIVGTCVAVCLWECQLRIGGVNHFLLARPVPSDTPDARYGSVAMAQLIQRMCRAGARAERLEGSVIGGGQPVDAIPDTSIGDQNAGLAMAVLREHRIRVVRQDTGGRFGRKLLFNTGTGELIVRRLGAAGVRQAERAWR